MSDDMIHELWVAAQLAPNEGIEDAVERMSTICGEVIDWKARIQKCRDYMDEIDGSLEFARNPEKFELQFRSARKLMDFLEDKA